MIRTTLRLGSALVLLGLLTLGCGKSVNQAVPFAPAAAAHPSNWIAIHWTEFLKNPDTCRTCHGSITDPSQAGGISKVSCFSCHTQGPVHLPGWASFSQHGRRGAELAPVSTTAPAVPVMAGFAHCTKCHGSDYAGGASGVSCKACHSTSPHPPKPWFDKTGATPSHSLVDSANVTECAKCHAGGANSTVRPTTAPAAGAAPGCYNATLCHGSPAHSLSTWIQNHWSDYVKDPAQCVACHGSTTNPAQAGGVARVSCFTCHPNGVLQHPTNWALSSQHGASALLAPVATLAPAVPVQQGFVHCAKCHGSDFSGGLSNVSCKACHTKAPHPAKPWLAFSGTTLLRGHDVLEPGNLVSCVQCHAAGANSDRKPSIPAPSGTAPGCSNATLCHG